MLCKPLEDFKVVGESFASATGILDCDRNICTGSKRECHGHSVIIVGIYFRNVQFLWWGDDTVIWPFFDRCSQLKSKPNQMCQD